MLATLYFWRNTFTNHNYNLYHMVCISVHLSGTFGASRQYFQRVLSR